MNAKEYLTQYKKLKMKIKLLEEDIAILEASIGSSPAPRDKDMPRSPSTRNTTEDMLVNLIDLKQDKEVMLHKAMITVSEISKTIEALAGIEVQNVVTYMAVLYDRYILDMSWADIAENIGYSEDHTRGYLHGKALLAISPLIPDKRN